MSEMEAYLKEKISHLEGQISTLKFALDDKDEVIRILREVINDQKAEIQRLTHPTQVIQVKGMLDFRSHCEEEQGE